MNVYDTLNRLAEEIKQSEEFINFKMAKQTISMFPELKEKILEFEKLRYEEQITAIQKGNNDKNNMIKIQNLYQNIIEIPEIKKYFDAELKFNILLGDINKTISEAVRELI